MITSRDQLAFVKGKSAASVNIVTWSHIGFQEVRNIDFEDVTSWDLDLEMFGPIQKQITGIYVWRQLYTCECLNLSCSFQ